jgi:hypothetical protein
LNWRLGALVSIASCACNCFPSVEPCPDAPFVLFLQENDDDEPDVEIRARAAPGQPRVSPDGRTEWVLAYNDTTTTIFFPPEVSFPPPPPGSCCDLRLPASRLSARFELQLFADDGLWLEIAAPPRSGTTEGMHASLAADDAAGDPARCSVDNGTAQTPRFRLAFSFASEPASFLESRTGSIDGIEVRGLVTHDIFAGDAGETGPQAVIGRTR